MTSNPHIDAMDEFILGHREKLSKEQRDSVMLAREAIVSMFQKGETAHTVTHSMLGLIAAMAMSTTPAAQEVAQRRNVSLAFFDYMTGCMKTDVCSECGYPHGNSECEDYDLESDLVEVKPDLSKFTVGTKH